MEVTSKATALAGTFVHQKLLYYNPKTKTAYQSKEIALNLLVPEEDLEKILSVELISGQFFVNNLVDLDERAENEG